jgi:hypothetical protein
MLHVERILYVDGVISLRPDISNAAFPPEALLTPRNLKR